MQFIQKLKTHFEEHNLPGRGIQFEMAHGVRKSWFEKYDIPATAREACTLALLYPKNENWQIVLIKRVAHEKDRHGGQVSFPGGKVEQSDDNLAHTALREVHEEIGVSPQSIAIIGKLTEVYIPVSNFYVHPFVGYLTEKPNFTPQPNEVQQIIEVPLEWLLDKNNQTTTNLTLPNGIELKSVPCFRIEGDIIWGATAMLLKELITIIEQVRQ